MWKFKSKKDMNKKILFVGNDGFRDFQLAEKLSSELTDFEFIYVSQNINENNINKSNSVIKKVVGGIRTYQMKNLEVNIIKHS